MRKRFDLPVIFKNEIKASKYHIAEDADLLSDVNLCASL